MNLDPAALQQALNPLGTDEVARLRRYLQLVERLTAAPLFHGGEQVGIDISPEGRVAVIAPVDELQMRGLLTEFRQLWMSTEPSAFPRIFAELRASACARGTAQAQGVIAWLDELGRQYREVRKSSPDLGAFEAEFGESGEVARDEAVRAERILDDWVNGDIFHSDTSKRERFENAPDRDVYWFALLVAVQDMTRVYVALGWLVKQILNEPSPVPFP
jgi:hypothetical protein